MPCGFWSIASVGRGLEWLCQVLFVAFVSCNITSISRCNSSCGSNGDSRENVAVVNAVEVREIRSLGFTGDLCSG